MEESSTWKVCISTKYSIESWGWYTLSPRGSYGLGLWKAIYKETGQWKQNYEMVLGNGKRIKFWEDVWCGGLPLSEAFLALYNNASSKEAMIADIWVLSGDQGAWDPKFERPFNDWELEAVQTFIGQINSRFTILQVQNKLIWKGNVSGVFTIKDYFNSLEEGPSCAAPTKILWNPHVPSKIGFFV